MPGALRPRAEVAEPLGQRAKSAPGRNPDATPVVVWKNIGVLRGAAICLVVIHHATHWAFSTRRIVLATSPMATWEGLLEVCGRALPPVSVPAFLFASGYFVSRFSSGWPAAKAGAFKVATRYIGWWVMGVLFFAIVRRDFDIHQLLPRFLFGGPFIAYWFFPLMIQLLLAAPLLVAACRRWPRAMIVGGACVEVLAIAAYYVMALNGRPPGYAWSQWNHVAVVKLPFFLYGILFSQHTDAVVGWLVRHRAALGIASLALCAATCAEAIGLGILTGDGGPASWGESVMLSESASMHLLALTSIGWVVTAPATHRKLREWLNGIGLKSLGILLLHDPVLVIGVMALWQARRIFGIDIPPGIPPAYMTVPWWLPLAAAAGIAVPIVVMQWTERHLGKRSAALLFG